MNLAWLSVPASECHIKEILASNNHLPQVWKHIVSISAKIDPGDICLGCPLKNQRPVSRSLEEIFSSYVLAFLKVTCAIGRAKKNSIPKVTTWQLVVTSPCLCFSSSSFLRWHIFTGWAHCQLFNECCTPNLKKSLANNLLFLYPL